MRLISNIYAYNTLTYFSFSTHPTGIKTFIGIDVKKFNVGAFRDFMLEILYLLDENFTSEDGKLISSGLY